MDGGGEERGVSFRETERLALGAKHFLSAPDWPMGSDRQGLSPDCIG